MQDKSQMELRLTVAALRSADLVASQLDLRLMATTGGSAVGSRWCMADVLGSAVLVLDCLQFDMRLRRTTRSVVVCCLGVLFVC
ncbi:hypothetical protein VIGAN_11160100 [Vigna angularis var. angularis]|uniref:Uncharacterized protein n=1 Tax=Vigna angularis var. angularis TaxID=157739 RepID=A0A0S3TAD0_PHAAN|nr:hypothetical protein VIGAN_11160100 [Vigna angularis var. angularis]